MAHVKQASMMMRAIVAEEAERAAAAENELRAVRWELLSRRREVVQTAFAWMISVVEAGLAGLTLNTVSERDI